MPLPTYDTFCSLSIIMPATSSPQSSKKAEFLFGCGLRRSGAGLFGFGDARSIPPSAWPQNYFLKAHWRMFAADDEMILLFLSKLCPDAYQYQLRIRSNNHPLSDTVPCALRPNPMMSASECETRDDSSQVSVSPMAPTRGCIQKKYLPYVSYFE